MSLNFSIFFTSFSFLYVDGTVPPENNQALFYFWPNNQSDTILNGIVVFLDHENVCLDTKIMILSGLEAEILIDTSFYMVAILKIQDGHHNVFRGSGSYQKWKAKAMGSMWGKFSAFVQNIHIHLRSCLTNDLADDWK